MSAVIWCKTNCPFCVLAKEELTKRNISYEERIIGQGWDKSQLLEAVPNARTVPQIFIDNILIGGYNDLMLIKQ